MQDGPASLVRAYIERVVNQRDLSAVDEWVSPSYRGSGHGWPEDLPRLRAFYRWQREERPDWRIDVQETVALGESVVVRAVAGGTVDGSLAHVEWLALYRVVDGRICEIRVLELLQRGVGNEA